MTTRRDFYGTNFVTTGDQPRSLWLMVQGLARLGSAALTIAEFTIVLVALLLLGATAIPSLVRVRKR